MTEIPEGMTALRDALIDAFLNCGPGAIAAADTALAPDGPLWKALRALGVEAHEVAGRDGIHPENYLALQGITGPLADACLAAAEVKP